MKTVIFAIGFLIALPIVVMAWTTVFQTFAQVATLLAQLTGGF